MPRCDKDNALTCSNIHKVHRQAHELEVLVKSLLLICEYSTHQHRRQRPAPSHQLEEFEQVARRALKKCQAQNERGEAWLTSDPVCPNLMVRRKLAVDLDPMVRTDGFDAHCHTIVALLI